MRADNGRFLPGSHWRPRAPHWDASWLREQYIDHRRSSGDIAREVGCTDASILQWLRKHGIPRRSIAEARTLKHWGATGDRNPMFGRTGAMNPRFVDGSSPERQRLYARGEGKAFRAEVLHRDGYRCRRCDASKYGRGSLHVHHLQAWAGNPSLRFDVSNAVTLCRTCHRWVHSRLNRDGEFLAGFAPGPNSEPAPQVDARQLDIFEAST
jgi:thymidylate synthase (FAD)